MQLEQITLDHLKRWALYTLLGVLAAIVLAFLGDLAQVHLRGASATDTVSVDRFMVTPLKGNKNEYDFLGQDDVTCTRSLFPQMGHDPCWYVRSHRDDWHAN